MKKLTAIIALFTFAGVAVAATPVEEINFQEALFGSNKNLLLKQSKGPKWGESLMAAMMEQWEQDTDFNEVFVDGMNHDAIEQCEPELEGDLQVDEADITSWPDLGGDFYAIKRTESGRSIAYLVAPWAEYVVEYNIVNDDYDLVEKRSVNCKVFYGESYIYKNTKDKSVQFLQKVAF